ncbi:hypothetical protein BBBOND_0212310 [Babesia bigemina]|uniref:C3H1-type domain-containing protein n=1 Tax=Babesia bigemina TaxID=5866 RepID=A0A061DAZ1_BABBI|nr:hypothetical protein BBBOND_0212310 [Babesia bigemina]CDR96089.1 hypothetical protein BBBOND_0212310 [Babesia bigemina]|eukprot:XP_012768275.1 hypothetical protein BBBOND_0212310 [Babesia bigemina]
MTSLNHHNNLCLVPLHFLSSTSCHCPDHVPPRELDKKFDKILNLKNTLNNNPTNILNNLCSGLETFLGFNPSSKGYTGNGIVYSDLDRLCDGVMGFLSGVLSNIKEHLGQHKNEITQAIDTLNTNKHLGKKGFNDAIGSVVKGVRKYNGFLKISNDRVSKPVVELLSYFTEESSGKFCLGFNDIQVDKVSDDPKQTDPEVTKADNLVTQCLAKANEFNSKLDSSVPKNIKTQNAINDLNHKLRERVHSVRETVKYETDRLTTLSRKEKENYDAIVKMVKKLESVQSCFKSEITQRVTGLVNKLKEDVQKIKEKLEAIYKELERGVSALDTWAWEADGFVSDVMMKVEKILEEVVHPAERKKSINYAAEYIKGQAMSMQEAGDAAKNAAQENVRLALTQVKEMNDALKMDLYTVKQEIQKAIVNHVKEQIKTPYDELEGNVKQDLTVLKGKIEGELEAIVESSTTFSEQLTATEKAVEHAIGIVHSDIEKLQELTQIEQIVNDKNINVTAKLLKAIGGSEVIFQKVTEYFSNLNTKIMTPLKDAMKKIGEGWEIFVNGTNSYDVKNAVKKAFEELKKLQVVVNDANIAGNYEELKRSLTNVGLDISGVTGDLNSKFTIAAPTVRGFTASVDSLGKEEAKRILKELGEIAEAVSEHSSGVVTAVMTQVRQRVKEEIKVAAQTLNAKVQKIQQGVNGYNHNTNVQYSVVGNNENVKGLKALVNQFDTRIKNTLSMFQEKFESDFFKKKKPSSVNNDYEFGPNLMKTFKTAYDDLKDGALQENTFKSRIEGILSAEIGGDILPEGGGEVNKIGNIGQAKYANYTKQVDQDSLTHRDIKSMTGGLPTAIKQIETKVTEALASIENLKSDIVSHADDVKSKLAAMCEIVKKAAEGNSESAKGKLSELRSKIGRNTVKKPGDGVLMKIKNDLETLKKTQLHECISAATDFSNHAERLKTSTISSLQDIVDTQLNDCMAELTKQANTHYVTTMHYLLEQFADKVRGQLDKLPEAIEEDLATGFKGFMGAFQGQNGQAANYDNIEKLKDIVDRLSKNPTDYKANFEKLANKFQSFWQPLKTYLDTDLKREYAEEMKRKTPPVTIGEGDKHPYAEQLENVKDKLNILLTQLQDSGNFTHSVAHNLGILNNAHDNLVPTNFSSPCNTLVDALKSGVNALVSELIKTYLNAYDGASDGMVLVDARNDKVTDDGNKCAKVCLSLLSILYSEFKTLLKYCVARCKSDQININTELGKYFATQGYKVTEDGKKHWELQDSKGMTGLFICKRMFGKDEHHLYYIDKSKQNALDTLHDCLQTYYQVSHIATFSARKRPCNIFEMLCWVSGLPCNNVYQDMLDDAISELFVDPSKQPEDADGIPVTYISDEPLPAYPQNIAMDDTQRAVKRLCSRSHDILTTIAGTGDAYSMYAVDYSTNSLNFHYPSKGEDCLQMLLDILRRLLPSLKFLHTQCGLSSAYHGWSGCQYGRGVKHSNWQCGEHPANESTDCLPRSPLMSYLRDSLPGCLPHQLVSAGCKSECKTCPKSLPGAPCITPLGFRGFSGSTKTGKDICTVLTKFFDNSNINALFGLLPKPPSTLPEHFQFALTLSSMLDNANAASDVSLAFVTKTKALSIDLYKETSKLTGALQNAYRNQAGHTSSDHSKSTEADLSSLSKDSCNLPHERDIHCAPYLCSTSSDAYTYLAKKHADLYLSWAVYLPWTFYSYLKSLLDAFQQIDCGGSGCTKCSCKPGKHGVEYSCKCKALISCRGVMTTFYQYGFTFGDAKTLYGTNRKFCLSFSTQLSNLLKSQHFTKLFEECDNFIWTIREPFTYLVLALWSLSLFYLVCVMVGRLDVLHIKSHLRSPSSHKITAQSLLAAAQVGRLAKISYLQP